MAQINWKKLVDDLLRLAQDEGATEDERDTARLKLAQVLENHPDAEEIKQYPPVREFTMGDLRAMKRRGISTDGRWEGGTLEDALWAMVSDYQQRARPRIAQPSSTERLRAMVSELEASLESLQ